MNKYASEIDRHYVNRLYSKILSKPQVIRNGVLKDLLILAVLVSTFVSIPEELQEETSETLDKILRLCS